MDKKQLLTQFIAELRSLHQGAVDAAARAHQTATDDENISQNRYDTLALEAAYLAQGQSKRVEQCAADIQAFQQLPLATADKVSVGSLVLLLDENDQEKWLFLGPAAGGLKITFADKEVMVVTESAPLGLAIKNQQVDDEVCLTISGSATYYQIIAIY